MKRRLLDLASSSCNRHGAWPDRVLGRRETSEVHAAMSRETTQKSSLDHALCCEVMHDPSALSGFLYLQMSTRSLTWIREFSAALAHGCKLRDAPLLSREPSKIELKSPPQMTVTTQACCEGPYRVKEIRVVCIGPIYCRKYDLCFTERAFKYNKSTLSVNVCMRCFPVQTPARQYSHSTCIIRITHGVHLTPVVMLQLSAGCIK